ncbi:hypothetical protein LCGC14_2276580, partial [marine sediment metagenome]
GTGQRIRGRRRGAHRPSLIICDDLQNDDHIRSAVQRENSRTWFHGTLLKAGTKETKVLNLATALHGEALAMELGASPGWHCKTFRAIERWPEQMSLWQEWESIYTDVQNPRYKRAARNFYQKHADAMHAGASVLWPEEEDLYTLMCMRAESGHSAFEREKQNSPINPEMCEWPEDYFDESIWFDTWPENLTVKTLALDPSKGADSRRGDYSALVMLGVDRRGVLYVEADMARRPTPQIVADVTALPVACATEPDTGALGAAMLAAGVTEPERSLADVAAAMAPSARPVRPGPDAEEYRQMFEQYVSSLPMGE